MSDTSPVRTPLRRKTSSTSPYPAPLVESESEGESASCSHSHAADLDHSLSPHGAEGEQTPTPGSPVSPRRGKDDACDDGQDDRALGGHCSGAFVTHEAPLHDDSVAVAPRVNDVGPLARVKVC